MNPSTQTPSPDTGRDGKKFHVALNGVLPNVSPPDAKAKLATLFKATEAQIENLLATPGHIVKRSCAPDIAAKYKVAIERAGGACALIADEEPAVFLDIELPKAAPPVAVASNKTENPARSSSPGTQAPENTIRQARTSQGAKPTVFCPKCGAEVVASAAFCGVCGAGLAIVEAKPSPSVTSATTAVPVVSEAWKKKFALLEKAGGPKLQGIRALTFGERLKLFGAWGFLFGPFYYLAKGMWKKAIVLTALCAVAVGVLMWLLEAVGISDAITNFVGPAVFGTRATVDYYKKIVLGDNGWW